MWKSGAILAYAEEALEQLPANLNIMGPTLDHKGSQVLIDRPISEEELAEWKAQLRKEMDALKEDVERKDVETEENINYWVNFYKENPGTLPQKVQSLPGKTVHMQFGQVGSIPTNLLEDGMWLVLLRQQFRLRRPWPRNHLPKVLGPLRKAVRSKIGQRA